MIFLFLNKKIRKTWKVKFEKKKKMKIENWKLKII